MTETTNQSTPWLTGVTEHELRRILEALYRVHGVVAVITDLDTVLERIMEESKALAQSEACSLMLFDSVAEELFFQVALGEHGDQHILKREVRLKMGQGIAGSCAAKRMSINVPDVSADARFFSGADAMSNFQTRSLLAVPMVDRDTLVGVIEVVNKQGGGAFSEADLHVMEMFGSLAATVISNARLIEENLRAVRLAAIGQAVAGVSHHTKNIITGMGGAVDLMDTGLQNGDIELLKRTWPILRRSTRRIAHFVEDMLAYSKPRTPLIEAIEPKTLFDEVAQTFWGLLVNRELALDVSVEHAPSEVFLDSRAMYRVLINLLLNAAEAAPLAGGRVRLSAARHESGGLCIEVSDNGSGVPDAIVHRIFEPFFSTKGTRGTGLGLAVTQKIVAEHGGTISVSRSPEGGALFRILLPQQAPKRGEEIRAYTIE